MSEEEYAQITTVTGSVYLIDTEHSRVMRIEGTHPPTDYQGPDNEWRTYGAISLGEHMSIVWPMGINWPIHTTVTSRIRDMRLDMDRHAHLLWGPERN